MPIDNLWKRAPLLVLHALDLDLLRVARFDADRRYSLVRQSMVEPCRTWASLETTRFTCGACLRMMSANSAGSEAHFPRQIREPFCRIESAVSALHTAPGPGADREPVFPLIGEQPPCKQSRMAGASRTAITPVQEPHAQRPRSRHAERSRGGLLRKLECLSLIHI